MPIARQMPPPDVQVAPTDTPALLQGGGNLNGHTATVFLGQSGTAGTKLGLPRQEQSGGSGNTGVT